MRSVLRFPFRHISTGRSLHMCPFNAKRVDSSGKSKTLCYIKQIYKIHFTFLSISFLYNPDICMYLYTQLKICSGIVFQLVHSYNDSKSNMKSKYQSISIVNYNFKHISSTYASSHWIPVGVDRDNRPPRATILAYLFHFYVHQSLYTHLIVSYIY